jgi:hypothetical protein
MGRSPIGRVTFAIRNMNGPYLVRLREQLIAEGVFPRSECVRENDFDSCDSLFLTLPRSGCTTQPSS